MPLETPRAATKMKASTVVSVALALAPSNALSVANVANWALDMLDTNRMAVRAAELFSKPQKRDLLQDIVTWDSHALYIHGERAMIFSGEIHPFRLPVPSLYLDLFQKIKALGFNMVSFYVDWALVEGKPGDFRADGIFDLKPFFDAASEAGIYLLARPGPYINAEVSGGGFPGWLQRLRGALRTSAPDYLKATDNYVANIAAIIADAQITKGGPVVLYQPENEYTMAEFTPFPDLDYFQYVIDQARDAGVVVPIINNDVWPAGNSRPGSGKGAVDIYGHDAYPVGFDCANPETWPENGIPTSWHQDHMRISPNTPYSIIEGGAFDPWGGWGFERCSRLVNHEFARVFYKNNYAAGIRIFNVYMTYGGTNWGNLGHEGGYTSYDYAAAIREDRRIDREKYSEIKLEAQFLKVSPGYLDTTPQALTRGVYSSNEAISITPLLSNDTGHYLVVRHTDYRHTGSASYTVNLPTSAGNITVPQLGGSLSLHGRDSKFHLTDYPVGDETLLYTTAEVFTWKKFGDKTIVVVYGGPKELHELAVQGTHDIKTLEGDGVTSKVIDGATVLQYETSSTRRVVQAGDLVFYLLDRNSAYNYWVPDLPGDGDAPAFGTSLMNPESVIVNGGYLVRSVSVDGSSLNLQADFNITTSIEIIGAPKGVSTLVLNGEELKYTKSSLGNWVAKPDLGKPDVKLPELSSLDWHHLDSLPEVQEGYDDSAWTIAEHESTPNPTAPLRTPVSLYGSDYGFHAGTLIFRGHFTAHGSESELHLWTQGGWGYASSVWLNGDFLGSFKGADYARGDNATLALPKLSRGKKYVFTIVVDNNGLHGNWWPGKDEMKEPRGIMDYALVSASGCRTRISPWKITGNLGGEDYIDKFRGPLNEGGLYLERKGYHLPSAPLDDFTPGSPFEGVSSPGISYYATTLTLDLPSDEYDIPLSFVFDNVTDSSDYRALLYVNGFQFGKYVSSIGPQDEYPVPEGILNYNGDNALGLAFWALDKEGAKLPGFTLKAGTPVLTGRSKVELVEGPQYSERPGAY
ncbi:putative beta-galactosidase A [Paramyrothecium foliicola]|nr:putative beta-galactosidase A [Paramyrothecium foliicola]